MIWFIVAGILAVIGSIMMLKPSARDTRLAKLRFDAIKEGLQVRQYNWQPDPTKTGIHDTYMETGYSLTRTGAMTQGELRYCVVNAKGWDTNNLPEGYSWHKEGSAEDGLRVREALLELGDELLLLEVWDNRVVLMAAEREGATAASYRAFLEKFL